MKFTGLLKTILVEASKFRFNYDKFVKPQIKHKGKIIPGLTPDEYFEIVSADPTTRMNDVDLDKITREDFDTIKAGEYVPWLIEMFLTVKPRVSENHPDYAKELKETRKYFFEDLYKITDDLKKFSRFKNRLPVDKRDINKLSVGELYRLVKDFDLELVTTTKKERKSQEIHPGAQLVFDGPNWRVVEISDKSALGKEAACFYGGNQKETRWCTSAPGLKWFEDYIKDGNLYVIYDKNDDVIQAGTGLPVERYQFHFEREQFMDKNDNPINLGEYLNGKLAEIKEFFEPIMFASIFSKTKKALKVRNTDSGPFASYVQIFGFKKIFDNMPVDIEEINISNYEGDFKLEIPKSIIRLQNLETLILINCIDELPDYVCELKNLQYLSVSENKKLKTIPSCFADKNKLPNFEFLNVAGCNLLMLPPEVEEKGVEVAEGGWDFSD